MNDETECNQIPCAAKPLVWLWLAGAYSGFRSLAYAAVAIAWGIGSVRLCWRARRKLKETP